MKLITKYNRVNIIATVAVLLVASVCYYFIVRYVLIHQLDNTLKVEEAEILSYVKTNDRLPEASNYRDQHINFTEVTETFRRNFSNINLCEQRHHENSVYRELSFPIIVNNKLYKASVTKSEEEVEDLVWLIVLITVCVIILLLLILFITNRVLLRKIWKPFYHTLESIKTFNLSNKKNSGVEKTNISEFDDLNIAVNTMQSRIIKDYETLKNFADNASHEMQTPLAILNSKLDLLIQEPNLNESQTKQLQSMYDAMSRLSKLNQSLLLLTKIENNQFTKADPLRLDILINEKLLQLEDLIIAKHLQLQTDLKETTVEIDHYLADILLNNLLGNAIRHNYENGNITISLNQDEMIISNSSSTFSFTEKNIFERFSKSENSEGIGLGLAIVKQICDNYRFTIEYFFENNVHSFRIRFK
ncbi:MAG TPA: HAMP domain-containing sensor histidine kinase [Puia sp.]|jgi:signal transduction histidine kinase|nr:HAMP domain-containing sensor histidine kinase [Puia sp.]